MNSLFPGRIKKQTCYAFSVGSFPLSQDMSRGILGSDRDVYYPEWFLGEWEAALKWMLLEDFI